MKIKSLLFILTLLGLQGSLAALVAHYEFDGSTADSGTSGGTASLGSAASIDTAGGAVVGSGFLSLSGSPTTDTSGSDGAVSASSFDWSGSDIRTLTFWMRASAGDVGDTNATLISLGSGAGTGDRFDIRLNGNNLRLELQGGGSTTATTLANDSWNHVAVVVPNAASTLGQVQYYLNGEFVGNFLGSTAINTGSGPLRMGDSYQDTARDFKGGLDDVRLYDEALSAPQIQAIYSVPEPSMMVLLCLSGLSIIRRRRS